MDKLLILFVILLLLGLLGCWYWARAVRLEIKSLRDQAKELIKRGADPNASQMIAIGQFLDRAEFYCNIWNFRLEWKNRKEAMLKLELQESILPPQPDVSSNGRP